TERGNPPAARSRWRLAALIGIGAALVVGGGLLAVTRPWAPKTCAATAATTQPEWSVPRRWNEALLDAIRRALPAPTVHARNLFHTSAAMWDAWAVYDPTASGYFVHAKGTT